MYNKTKNNYIIPSMIVTLLVKLFCYFGLSYVNVATFVFSYQCVTINALFVRKTILCWTFATVPEIISHVYRTITHKTNEILEISDCVKRFITLFDSILLLVALRNS